MRHITITGCLGSGKSVISLRLKEFLNMEIESIGSLQRKMALNYKMTTIEFNKYMESHPEFDKELDNFVKEQGLGSTPKIFDSRLAWYFIPHSFKVYLYVKDEIAANRIFYDKKRIGEKYNSKEETLNYIQQRRKSEIYRFKNQYNIDLEDLSNYDLVIDTSFSNLSNITNIIIDNYKKENDFVKTWISPFTLNPTEDVREYSIRQLKDVKGLFSDIKDYINNPILLIIFNNRFYIYDGHKRTLNSIIDNVDLLPCILMNKNDESCLSNGQSVREYVSDNFLSKYTSDWNDFIDFIKCK